MLSATVGANISYGLPQLSLHDFITTLHQGYETPIGDSGMGLSGNQAQRVAIARALIRKPAVLILDEATSALDVKSANLIRDTVERLVKDPYRAMTVIIITHNRKMMEAAENIVVLDKGTVVERGGSEELMATDSALKNLLSGGEWVEAKAQRVNIR
jgi:ATP-binding cassette, subfamily B (MDR/TAP), member 1